MRDPASFSWRPPRRAHWRPAVDVRYARSFWPSSQARGSWCRCRRVPSGVLPRGPACPRLPCMSGRPRLTSSAHRPGSPKITMLEQALLTAGGPGSPCCGHSTPIRSGDAAATGESQTQMKQFIPRVPFGQPLDDAVDCCGMTQRLRDLHEREAVQVLLHQILMRGRPDPRLAPQHRKRLAGGYTGDDLPDGTDLFADRPQHERWRRALAPQTIDHPRQSQRITFHQRFAEVENVVARYIEHGVVHLIVGDTTGGKKQGELAHFLVRGHEVAFDAVRNEVERRGVGILILRLQPV